MAEADRPGAGQGLWQLSLAQFRHAVAERALPGCGAVTAVSADLAVALIVKALRVSAAHCWGVPVPSPMTMWRSSRIF